MTKFHFAGCPNLYIKDGIYFYRLQVSASQFPNFGGREVRRSLRTRNPKLAKLRCAQADILINKLIEKVEGELLGQDHITPYILKMVRSFFDEELADIMDFVEFGPSFGGFEFEKESASAAEYSEIYKKMAVRQNFSPDIQYNIDQCFEGAGKSIPLENSDIYKEAGVLVCRAKAETRRICHAHLEGNFEQTAIADPLFKSSTLGKEMPESSIESITLSECIKRFKDAKEGDVTIASLLDYNRVLSNLVEWLGGETSLLTISLQDVRIFKDAQASIPSNYSKLPAYKDLPLLEVVEKSRKNNEPKTIGIKTQRKNFSLVKAFFQWSVNEGYLETSPVKNLSIKVKKKIGSVSAKIPFDHEDLDVILNSPLFTGYLNTKKVTTSGTIMRQLPQFWFMLISLFSGMRLAEIVQLQYRDIIEDKGILCFSVNIGENEEKSVKTNSSVRIVPIHRTLIDLGLLTWIKSGPSHNPAGFVFSSLRSKYKKDLGNAASKRMNRYLRNIGIVDKKKTFHCFRHSFIDALRNQEVMEYTIEKIVGHSNKSVTSGYGVGPSMPVKKTAVDSAFEGINFDYLKLMI